MKANIVSLEEATTLFNKLQKKFKVRADVLIIMASLSSRLGLVVVYPCSTICYLVGDHG